MGGKETGAVKHTVDSYQNVICPSFSPRASRSISVKVVAIVLLLLVDVVVLVVVIYSKYVLIHGKKYIKEGAFINLCTVVTFKVKVAELVELVSFYYYNLEYLLKNLTE